MSHTTSTSSAVIRPRPSNAARVRYRCSLARNAAVSASDRSSIHFTGAPSRLATAATAISSRPTTHFCPKPPPMSGTVTRTAHSASPTDRASIVRTWCGTWVQVCTSSWSS